jgi:Uncharacterized stress protein (general stress protein 26)
MELNYDKLKAGVAKKLRRARTITLATCGENGIAARTVCCNNDGLTLFFVTQKDSQKAKDIMANPNVALVVSERIRIDAVAELFGHPSGKPDYLKKSLRKFPIYARIFPTTPDDMLVIIRPTKIRIFGRAEQVLDVIAERAYKDEK